MCDASYPWAVRSVVDRLLCMLKVEGSNPSSSILFALYSSVMALLPHAIDCEAEIMSAYREQKGIPPNEGLEPSTTSLKG